MKNYTSEVSVERTIGKIEAILGKIGAVNILKEYENQRLTSVKFAVIEPNTQRKITIIIPVNAKAVEAFFISLIKEPYPSEARLRRIHEQAERTAWKLMQEWLEIQLSLIEMSQVEILQVFLPYVYVFDSKKSLYESLKDKQFKLLGYTPPEERE